MSVVKEPVRSVLRLEGLGILVASIVAYSQLGLGWGLFALLFFLPDLAIAGYLAGPRAGALAYNAAHSLGGPLALGLVALGAGVPTAGAIASIWIAHVGFDRALGYGLKYPSDFKDTHLGRIGGSRGSPSGEATARKG